MSRLTGILVCSVLCFGGSFLNGQAVSKFTRKYIVDNVKDSLENFCSSKGDLLVKGVIRSDELNTGRELWKTETAFEISTSKNASLRHVALSMKMFKDDKLMSKDHTSSLFRKNESVLNYKVFGYDDRYTDHYIAGRVKEFGIGDIEYLNAGYLLGICEPDCKTFRELVDVEKCTFIRDEQSEIVVATYRCEGQGEYLFHFSASDFKIGLIRIKKLAGDKYKVAGTELLGDLKFAPNERYSSLEIKIDEFIYVGDDLRSIRIRTRNVGERGTEGRREVTCKVTSQSGFVERSLFPEKLYLETSPPVLIHDDRNIRYKIDGKGKVRKVVDPRAVRPKEVKNEGVKIESSEFSQQVLESNKTKSGDLLYENYLRSSASRAHCGVYSLMAIFDKLETPYEVDRLLDGKYVGSSDGSSFDELLNACADHDVDARAFENLTVRSLRHSKSPFLLLLEPIAGEGSNHWVAFLGDAGGEALIVDPPRSLEKIDYKMLLASWKGRAIVVGNDSSSNIFSYQTFVDKIGLLLPTLLLVLLGSIFVKLLVTLTVVSLAIVISERKGHRGVTVHQHGC